MNKQKEIGYEISNIMWHHLPGFKELWNKTDFDVKEYIVKEQGRVAIEQVIESQRGFLTKFAIFVTNNIHRGCTPASLVEDFYKNLLNTMEEKEDDYYKKQYKLY